MKCDYNNCLNCELPRCKHDVRDRIEFLDDFEKLKEKKRHARYYQEHRDEIIQKQKERDKDRTERVKKYYEKNKESISEKRHRQYVRDRENRLKRQQKYYQEHRDEILAKRKARREHKQKTESM